MKNWFQRNRLGVQIFFGLLLAFLVFGGFYCFIKDENWLAVSALATLLLAIASFCAIRQNKQLHKMELMERLLNEITEWAEEASKTIEVVIYYSDNINRINAGDQFQKVSYIELLSLLKVKTIGMPEKAHAVAPELKKKVEEAVADFNEFKDRYEEGKSKKVLEQIAKKFKGYSPDNEKGSGKDLLECIATIKVRLNLLN